MGSDNQNSTYDLDWNKSICSTLKSSDVREVKKLRKLVLLSLQLESDKTAKKKFKRAVKQLEDDGTLTLDAEGTIDMNEKNKRKSETEKKSKKKKKKRKSNDYDEDDEKRGSSESNDATESTKDRYKEKKGETEPGSKNSPCSGNPQGVTRLFLGNLPFSVDESSLGAFLPGEITHIKWITDKETGKFYGSAFIEMQNSIFAAEAVAMAGSKLIGRPIKINFAPAREGDVWPPVKKVVSGGGGQAGGSGIKAMSSKPDNCVKLFIGNLSYDIDDEEIKKFFAIVEAEVKAVRWLHHKDSGDFKGCGYVEFWNTEACGKGATLNGKNVLGRPIRIDWTD